MNNYPKKRVLITGANGFIGRNITHFLLDSGFDVTVLLRKSYQIKYFEHARCTPIIGELENRQALIQAVKNIEYVIHLAGCVKTARKHRFYKTNTQGTENLMSVIATHGAAIQHVCFVSSLEAGGASQPSDPRSEHDQDHPITAYGRSKKEAEKIVLNYRTKVSVSILRPPAVYGPGDKGFLPFFKTIKNGISVKIGHKKREVSIIYVKQLGRIIRSILESVPDSGKIYYVSDSIKTWTWEELETLIANSLNQKKVKKWVIPDWTWWTLCHIGQTIQWLTGVDGWINRTRYQTLAEPCWTCSIRAINNDYPNIGEQPIEEGLKETGEWYKKNNWI